MYLSNFKSQMRYFSNYPLYLYIKLFFWINVKIYSLQKKLFYNECFFVFDFESYQRLKKTSICDENRVWSLVSSQTKPQSHSTIISATTFFPQRRYGVSNRFVNTLLDLCLPHAYLTMMPSISLPPHGVYCST